jgi:serine/threonine protein kinase
MGAMASSHLTEETLRRYSLGTLDAAECLRITSHLAGCPECLERMAGITSTSFAARQCPTQAHGDAATAKTLAPGTTRTESGELSPAADEIRSSAQVLIDHSDYKMIQELGRGGMGVVYLVHNKLMARDEVLKVLERRVVENGSMHDRFQREIRAVARLRHPNIVAAYSAFRSGEHLILAMEYVEGLDLARMVKAKGPMPVAHGCYFVHQAALGLQHAHEEGMVHRDIKPSNLMLSHTKGRAVIKILDFGLAKATREIDVVDIPRIDSADDPQSRNDLTLAGSMLGTPEFVAPEQTIDAQKADIRSDIYSLGCTLYYLLSGHPPFPRTTLVAIIVAHRTQIATPLNIVRPDVPSELAIVVARMMEKEPSRRFQTPAEVAQALTPFFKKNDNSPQASARVLPGGRTAAQPVGAASSVEPTLPVGESATISVPIESARNDPGAHSIWEKLIEFEETDLDSSAGELESPIPEEQTARSRTVFAAASGVAAILLVGGLIFVASRIVRTSESGDSQIQIGSGGAEKQTESDELIAAPRRKSSDRNVALVDLRAPGAPGQLGGAELSSPEEVGDRTKPDAVSASSSNDAAIRQVPSAVEPSPPAPSASVPNLARPEPPAVAASAVSPLVKSPRWEWIHGASMAMFERWVESLRPRGYRPSFVNGHDLASRVKISGEQDVSGEVRITAVAVRDEPRLAFQVALDPVEKSFAHYLEIGARGYHLTAQTCFTNGTSANVLAVFCERGRGAAFWFLSPESFPEPMVKKWLEQGVRPVAVAGRPAGDFWKVTMGAIDSAKVDWKVHAELSRAELDRVLVAARRLGMRPESLFVCPGTVRGGFGVVLTNDSPSLIWEVHPELSSTQLDSDRARMADKGYAADQVVGYAKEGVSRYLVSWTRDPGRYPATGLTDRAIEPIDIVVEQFLVEHRIPRATMAVFRAGRLAMSRGYGHRDSAAQDPTGPATAMPLGDLSAIMSSAAANSSGPAHVPDTDVAANGIDGIDSSRASAPDVGRFFIKNQFDGRPLPARVKPKNDMMIGRRGPSLTLIQRHDDLLVVLLAMLPEAAPPQWDDALRKGLDEAFETLQISPSGSGKRKTTPR